MYTDKTINYESAKGLKHERVAMLKYNGSVRLEGVPAFQPI